MKINSGPYSDHKKANAVVRVVREFINNKIKTQPIAIRLFVVISYDIFHILQQNL